MDVTDPKSYLPVSNLSILSKLLERFVSQQLAVYLKDNNLLSGHQSVNEHEMIFIVQSILCKKALT